LGIHLAEIFGSASIGVYTLTTDSFAILPKSAPKRKIAQFQKWLGVNLVVTDIGGSVLIGVLSAANSNGILLPHFIKDEELSVIKSALDINVTVMENKETAFGNMVLANDYGAVVSPHMSKKAIKKVEDTLGVEAVKGRIAGLWYVGSLAVATNQGVLTHPMVTEEEREVLEEVLKVRADVGTVNCGIPYISTGLLCNTHNAVVGFITTGPELFIIGNAFNVVGEDE